MSLLVKKARFKTYGENVRWVPIERVVPAVSPEEKGVLGARQLAQKIEASGVFEAIEVKEYDGEYYIEDGNTRYAAARILGMKEVPVGDIQTTHSKTSKSHENASTQIDVPASVARKIYEIGKELIPDEMLAGEGRVTKLHVTVKYGVREDAETLRQAVAGRGSFPVMLGKTEVFQPSESEREGALPVVVEVHGHELEWLHDAVTKSIGTVIPNDKPYVPHITIAYVKPAESTHFAGSDAFHGISFSADAITLYKHDDTNFEVIKLEKALPAVAAAVEPEIPQVAPEVPQPQQAPEQIKRDEPAVEEEEPEEDEYAFEEEENDEEPQPQPEHSTFPLPEQSDAPRDRGFDDPRPVTKTKAFKSWFANSQVVDDDGNPMIVYHGTTHEISEFDPNVGHEENHYGKGMYFTDSKLDAAANYATEVGPDLTQRIGLRAEQIFNGLQEEWDAEHPGEDFPEYGSRTYNRMMNKAKGIARQEIAGEHGGATVPVYLSMQNPVIVEPRGGTTFELQIDEDGNETGSGIDLYNAMMSVASRYNDADAQEIWNRLIGNFGESFEADDFEKIAREQSITNDNGDLVAGQFIQDVYREMGFDGIIQDAYAAFGPRPLAYGQKSKGMKMDRDTRHYIPFNPSQVKSALGAKKFDPKSPSITAADTGVGDLGLAKKILHELLPVLGEPNLPEPPLKIVNQPRARQIGRDIWRVGLRGNEIWGEENTRIELQKVLLDDEQSLRRILAHELCHHADNLVNGPKLIEKYQGTGDRGYNLVFRELGETAHGAGWKQYAQKFNAKYGANFVTEKSDETYATKPKNLKPYYMALWKHPSGKIYYSVASRLGSKALKYLWRKRMRRDESERLMMTTDPLFVRGGASIGGGWSVPDKGQPQIETRLEELWNEAGNQNIELPNPWNTKQEHLIDPDYWKRLLEHEGKEVVIKPLDKPEMYEVSWRYKTSAKRSEQTTSLTLGIDSEKHENIPPVILIRWELGMRWREVLKVVKAIAGEIAGKRVAWRDIYIWSSLWENQQEQNEGWEQEKARHNKVMYDILHNGSYVSVGAPLQQEAFALGGTEKEADAHKVTPEEETWYNMPEYGTETNAYANIPERVRGMEELPDLETLAPQMFEKQAMAFPSFEAWVQQFGGIEKVLREYDVDMAESYGYDLEPPEDTPEAKQAYEEALYQRATADFEQRYDNYVAEHSSWEFPLDVFRCISLPKDPNPAQQHLFPGTPQAQFQQALQAIQYQGVGIYWAWEEKAAECHWGTGGAHITLHAVVNEDNVDWDGTLYANMDPSIGDAEKEIRLKEGTQFELVGIQYEDRGAWQQPPVKTVTASSKIAVKNLKQALMLCRPNIARKAQEIYDAWTQDEEGMDEEFGGGGICDEIAEAIMDVVANVAFEVGGDVTEGGQPGDDHAWVVAYTQNEVYGVDIPHAVYETGGGYSWKKVPGVQFTADDVEVFPLNVDPSEFSKQGAAVQFTTETRGAHHGQTDMTLFAEVNGQRVGYVEYSDYNDQPSVQYIKVTDKRKGYGTALLKELQRMYPNIEIDLGGTTDEGTKLVESLNFREEQTEHAEKFKEYERLKEEEKRLQAIADDFHANPTEEKRQALLNMTDEFNAVSDRIWELEQELYGKSPTKRIISNRMVSRENRIFRWIETPQHGVVVGKPRELHWQICERLDIPTSGHNVDRVTRGSVEIDYDHKVVTVRGYNEEFPSNAVIETFKSKYPGYEIREAALHGSVWASKTAVYAEAQNEVRHMTTRSVGMSKTLKSDPFAVEREQLALSHGQEPPEPNPVPQFGPSNMGQSLPQAEGETEVQNDLAQNVQKASHMKEAKKFKKDRRDTIPGTVYLLHFDILPGAQVDPSREDASNPFHARHYMGWSTDVQERIRSHYQGGGAKIMRALKQKGLSFTVARIWEDKDRNFERRLKSQGSLTRHCPICAKLGLIPASRMRGKALENVEVVPEQYQIGPDYLEVEKQAAVSREFADKGEIQAHREGRVLIIDWFHIKPEFAGKGWGKKLYTEWEKNLPKDIVRLELNAAQDAGSGPAEGFWDKMGFEYMYDQQVYDPTFDNAMWKGVNGVPTPKAKPIPDDYWEENSDE
jgi:2'-5' RNA ligase/GNAT superfamily N-acetyltransferase